MSPTAWWLAARPKTLTAAIAPVWVGSALAYLEGELQPLAALAALLGALLIQIGTNLANDVSDFRRGADTPDRLGPTRVVQAGLLTEMQVTAGAAVAFVAAGVVGLYLISLGGLPIAAIGVAGVAAGILYTAGPLPLAYVGLGDAFVLIFFGVAAVAGTYYLQAGNFSPEALTLGVAVGCLAVMLLAVNNLRDVATDAEAGKRTLAVRLGPMWMRRYIAVLAVAAVAVPVLMIPFSDLEWPVVLVLGALPAARRPVAGVLGGMSGAELNAVLGQTARLQLVHAVLLGVGLLVGRWI